MPLNRNISLMIGTAIGVTTVGTIAVGQLGPLQPPNGAVANTSPSLEEVEDQIDLIRATLNQQSGPWESFVRTPGSHASDQHTSIEVAPGNVRVHQITAYEAYVAIFDGPGDTGTSGAGGTNNVVARVNSVRGPNMSGNTSVVPLNVEVQNGLHVAYDSQGSSGLIQILYSRID
ncbi:MAG: hypothetical protein AAF138_00815 [Planctomycetota bacterium]